MLDTMSNGGPPAKKCDATVRTVEKWIAENDNVVSMAKWLSYNKVHQGYIAVIKVMYASTHFKDKSLSSRNFNPALTIFPSGVKVTYKNSLYCSEGVYGPEL